MSASTPAPSGPPPGALDARGPRFAAGLTTVVLIVVLLTASGWLLLAQTVVFAIGALFGIKRAPYGFLYRTLVQPRLPKPSVWEDPAPPRFAQAVGFVFAAVGSIGYLSGVPVLGLVFTALALAAAFLNVAFNYCLGCEMYLLLRRLSAPRTA